MKPLCIAVTGYASLDYSLLLETPARPGWTSRILSRPREAWPRPGGCPYYVASAMGAGGLPASVITWIGDDSMGQVYLQRCQHERIGLEGIHVSPGRSTLTSVLAYQESGECACLVDFGDVETAITPPQRSLLGACDVVCFTVGPPMASASLLSAMRPDARIAWVAKNDAESFPETLRHQLGERASFIFCNGAERAWIDEAVAGRQSPPVIVQTNGEDPVLICRGDRVDQVRVSGLRVADATGAGDTLAGATLAALLSGADVTDAVATGCAAAHALLSMRCGQPT